MISFSSVFTSQIYPICEHGMWIWIIKSAIREADNALGISEMWLAIRKEKHSFDELTITYQS